MNMIKTCGTMNFIKRLQIYQYILDQHTSVDPVTARKAQWYGVFGDIKKYLHKKISRGDRWVKVPYIHERAGILRNCIRNMMATLAIIALMHCYTNITGGPLP